MKILLDDLKKMVEQAASDSVNIEEAKLFAELYLETHLRKAPRMNPIQEAINDITAWRKAGASASYEVVAEKEGITLYDFKALPPSLKIKEIHDTLESKAGKCGIAAAGIFNSGGIITLNMWADGLAKRGLIGIAMFNGGTECCVPPGAKRGVLGTNPLAYAIPTLDYPVALDMATTEIPFFDVKNAKAQGKALKIGAAVDFNGDPTTDPARALSDDGVANLLPLGGGFKGFGIMMLIEVLTGSLVRSLLSTSQSHGWNPPEYGAFIIAIDIKSFTDPDLFKRSISDMCEKIRSMEPASGWERVSMPGDRGHQKFKEASAGETIEIDEAVLGSLKCIMPDAD